MKCRSMITLSLTALLTACGSSNSNNSPTPIPIPNPIETPTLELVLPQQGDAMVEGFPIALYITYPAGEYEIDAITSIDVNWPSFDIHQSGKETGYIDGDSNELFYYSQTYSSTDALNAVDLERQEHNLWFVSGDNQLHRHNSDTGESNTWALNSNAQFTELTIDEQSQSDIWLYDQAGHTLVHFNLDSEQTSEFTLNGEVVIAGLSIADNHLMVLANDNQNHAVMHYAVDGTQLTHQKSWLLEGFEGQFFNDISLFPDGRVAVSTTDTEQNLYLVVDKSELIGDGPVEDHGELQRVAQFQLDESIKQPSGIWSQPDGSWLLITDQAEMYALDAGFNIVDKYEIAFDSINCNQGCTEAIVGIEDGFFAITDEGLVGHFGKDGESYRLTQEFQIDVKDADGYSYNYSGLAYDAINNEFYLVSDDGNDDNVDQLIVLNPDFTLKSMQPISYCCETDGSIFQYTAQGVHYADGYLYVLSEMFTKLLKINLSGEIEMVIDLSEEDVSSPSDLAIRDGQIYITGDHENDEPVPPISVFEIVQN